MNEKRLFAIDKTFKLYEFYVGGMTRDQLQEYLDDEIRRILKEFADEINLELPNVPDRLIVKSALEKRGVKP